MRDWVKTALADGIINSADTAFADLMHTMDKRPSDYIWNASALASAAVQNGDVCTTVSEIADKSDTTDKKALRTTLLSSELIQDASLPVSLPLVLDKDDRLYLSRYWQAEYNLANALLALVQKSNSGNHNPADIPAKLLDQLFPPSEQAGPDWQRVATVVAARQHLCVITGGPGTGKTRTVARLLALLRAQLPEAPRIALLAPTGKAAARLFESLSGELTTLKKEGLQLELPGSASTVHRALGYLPGRKGFKHTDSFPLPFDIVLVDEASMVDLTLMYSLVSALEKDSRLILLGDRDQLASVEAGNVLGDIVGDANDVKLFADETG